MYKNILKEKLIKIEIPKVTILVVKSDRPCLKNDKSIATKGVDKGSAVVVWDT